MHEELRRTGVFPADRVVHQHVQSATVLLNALEHPVDCVVVTEVATNSDRSATLVLDRLGDLMQRPCPTRSCGLVDTSTCQVDGRSAFAEHLSDPASNAATGTSYQRHSPREIRRTPAGCRIVR